MADRNVPDEITTGVMGNSQGNREGVGDTDLERTYRTTRDTFEGEDRRRSTSNDWQGVERRRKKPEPAAPKFEATIGRDEKGNPR